MEKLLANTPSFQADTILNIPKAGIRDNSASPIAAGNKFILWTSLSNV